ncbi:MAG: dTMP kinase [Henriciella sp.]|nr:dTMP kinase [Henriciella sp.]
MSEGIFITLEGGEGTGKSTLIANLQHRLHGLGIRPVLTREPGGTPLAEAVRSLALFPPDGDTWTPLAQALLMNAARTDHLEKKIIPALASGDWVICDRFADSTRAYQSIDGVAEPVLRDIERAVVGDTMPDVTFILDADPAALVARRSQRGGSDAFEAQPMAFHESVRAAFLKIAQSKPERCIVLDALQSPDEVADRAMAHLRDKGFIS